MQEYRVLFDKDPYDVANGTKPGIVLNFSKGL
jgi:hypothetical protein